MLYLILAMRLLSGVSTKELLGPEKGFSFEKVLKRFIELENSSTTGDLSASFSLSMSF
jgi:hypothetical protein